MPDVKERIMSNRKYIKSLLLGMSVMMTILIAIQIYLTVYVLKHNEMLPRILSCTALILDIIILAVFFVRINADVDSMAYTDVTGINNKLAYQNHIIRLNNADDTFLVGVIMFDLNNLKRVNDTLGHEMGDRYIESFSAILAGVQNERISAYRIGGDEFCVILEKTNAVEIHQILDSLERKINVYNEKNNIKISYAKGYEISTREHYYLMEELTKRADSRMYENKRLMKGKRLDGRRLNV
mgnify:CR=1 FL=1